MAVLLLPVVLLRSASKPIAVLAPPVVFESASSPRTVFSLVKQPSWQTAWAGGDSVKQVSVSASGIVANEMFRFFMDLIFLSGLSLL